MVSRGHLIRQLFIILKCLEKGRKFWKSQGKIREFHQEEKVGTMHSLLVNGCFTLSDSDSEGFFPLATSVIFYIAQIQTRIPIPDGCIGNPSPNLSPTM